MTVIQQKPKTKHNSVYQLRKRRDLRGSGSGQRLIRQGSTKFLSLSPNIILIMELKYDYKNVNWKAAKAEWDKNPMFFTLVIEHNANRVAFQAYVTKGKKVQLWLFINGSWEGTYTNAGHEFQKYHATREILPGKRHFDYERKFDKKLRGLSNRQIMAKKKMPIAISYMPWFNTIAQIKKMVTALE